MANSTTGFFGLRPVRYVDGSPYSGATITCYKSASYAVAMYIGESVMISNATADADALGRYLSIERATEEDGGQILGVVTGFIDNDSDLVYSPASTEALVKVCIAKDVVFQMKGGGTGTPAASTHIGQNCAMAPGTPSTITGLSGASVDESTQAQDASLPLVLLGIAELPDNELADYAVWDVLINVPQLFNLGGATAVGRHLGVAAT